MLKELGGVIGGLLGKNAAKSDLKAQKQLMQQMVEEYKKLGYAPDVSQALALQKFADAGQLTPELEQEIQLADSQMANVKNDEALMGALRKTLAQQGQIADTGFSAEDRAAANEINNQLARTLNASRQSGLQKAQSMGQGTGGAALMALLAGDQEATQKASNDSQDMMANMSAARRQALQQYANQAESLRNAQYNADALRAQALDERNRMLAQNSVARQASNVNRLNAAQQYNLDLKQKDVAAANDELRRQADAKTNQYNQNLSYLAGKTGQMGQLADFRGQQAQRKYGENVQMGQGIGGLADSGVKAAFGVPEFDSAGNKTGTSSGYGEMFSKMGSYFSDKELKNDVDYSDDDVVCWMNRIAKQLKGEQ